MDEDYEPVESPANEVEDNPVTGQIERQLMTLRERKQNFDRLHVDKDKLTSLTLMGYMWYSDESMSTMSQMWKASAVKRCSSKPRYGRKCFSYLCDWYPVLFGVDEEVVPSSDDDGEGFFDNLEELRDLEEKAEALTQTELDALRIGSKEDFTEEQLKAAWVKSLLPRYGRRARAKPILEIPGRPPFECICHIDNRFVRRYIPHFGGGVKRSDQDWRVPHFVAFWEEHHEKTSIPGMAELTKIFENQPKPEEDEAKHLISRPILKFSGTTKSEKKKFREHLFASFRPLDCREIRRYRMPYSEALYLELQEDRFVESAFFFRKLIVKDYYINILPDNLSTSLRLNKTRLNKLVEFLKVAERFSRRKEYHSEAITLMKIGKYFNDRDESCWWIAEEFYIRAVKVSQMSVLDGKKYEAIARYILGTFLLDFVNRVQLAREHLSKARELSLGKDWNASRILNKTQGPVYKECSNYLCRALIASSIELRENGKSNEALPLIHQSYKLCQEPLTVRPDIEIETLFELGMTYQDVGMLDWAKIAFRKFIERAKLQNHLRRVCDGYLEMAICLRSEGNLPSCFQNLNLYLETAKEKKDENLIAFGNRYIGEFHLNNGNAKLATDYFHKAFQSFNKQCQKSLSIPFNRWKPEHFTLPHDVELARVLVGLAEGEILTKPVCRLILKARDGKNQTETLQLINWKNKREKIFLNISDDRNYMEDPSVAEIEQEPSEVPILSFGSLQGDFFVTTFVYISDFEIQLNLKATQRSDNSNLTYN